MATTANPPQEQNPVQPPLPVRTPLPLNAGQEQQIRDIYYKNVRSYCADEIREFASCAVNRTFSATWKCRSQRLAMNGCMLAHATREEQDRAREEWFTTREKRRKEREEKQEKRKEQEKFHHDYWGLDEHGRRLTDRSQIKKVEELVDPGK